MEQSSLIPLDGQGKKNSSSPEINEMFKYWQEKTRLPITSRIQKNRWACSNLLKKYKKEGLQQLINAAAVANNEKYAPKIHNFETLQTKQQQLILWGRSYEKHRKYVKHISKQTYKQPVREISDAQREANIEKLQAMREKLLQRRKSNEIRNDPRAVSNQADSHKTARNSKDSKG